MLLLSLSISAGYFARLTFGFASLTTMTTIPLPFSKDHITTLLLVHPMAWVLKDLNLLEDSSSYLSTISFNYCSTQAVILLPLFETRAHEQTIYQFVFLTSEQVYFLWFLHSTETDIFLDIFRLQQLLLPAVWQ